MAATVDVVRWCGALKSGLPTIPAGNPGYGYLITNINTDANACDDHVSSNQPVKLPGTWNSNSTTYSYWVSTRLWCSASPVGRISNLRWYTSGANNIAAGIYVVACEAAAYVQATGTTGFTGNALKYTAHSGLTGALLLGDGTVGQPWNYTVGAPYVLSIVSQKATGTVGNLMVYQFVVTTACTTIGSSGTAKFSWAWDET